MKFTDFGFKENPFAITPDPRYLYLSRGHEESLAHLIYGTGPNGGFVLLTGEVGTGKTLLIRSLLAQQLADVDIALVLNPRLSRREFLATICDELGVQYPGPPLSLKKLSDVLSRHLLKTHGEGRHTVLVVDEAQNLSPRVLEQVRLLTNLETTRHKLLRIILVGQPELLQILSQKELRQVDQRITARYHLSPLDRQETARYIVYRLAVAGIREDLFTPMAMRLVHRFSGGVPRKINTLCERTLLAIFSRGKSRVGPSLVWQAAREVKGSMHRLLKRWLLAALMCLVIGLALYAYWSPELPTAPLTNLDAQTVPASESAALKSGDSPDTIERRLETGESIPMKIELVSRPETAQAPPVSGREPDEARPPTSAPPVETTPPSQAINLSVLFSQPPETNEIYQKLFALWGKSINSDSTLAPCAQAPELGLRCLKDVGDLERVLELNRPLILRLKQKNEYRLVLLKRIDEEGLVIDAGQGETRLTLSQLNEYWEGEFVLLWRPPEDEALIGKGSVGAPVSWLRRQLGLVDGVPFKPAKGLDQFDASLKSRLQAFQRSKGLQDDGVAGQETMIYLNNLLLPPGTPTLQSTLPGG